MAIDEPKPSVQSLAFPIPDTNSKISTVGINVVAAAAPEASSGLRPLTPPPLSPAQPSVVPVPGPNEVWLWGGEYRPSVLVIPAGTTITWVGIDAEGHDVESDIPGLFHMGVAPGTTFNFTFTEPGSFCYHCCCGLLNGEIIVTPK